MCTNIFSENQRKTRSFAFTNTYFDSLSWYVNQYHENEWKHENESSDQVKMCCESKLQIVFLMTCFFPFLQKNPVFSSSSSFQVWSIYEVAILLFKSLALILQQLCRISSFLYTNKVKRTSSKLNTWCCFVLKFSFIPCNHHSSYLYFTWYFVVLWLWGLMHVPIVIFSWLVNYFVSHLLYLDS